MITNKVISHFFRTLALTLNLCGANQIFDGGKEDDWGQVKFFGAYDWETQEPGQKTKE